MYFVKYFAALALCFSTALAVAAPAVHKIQDLEHHNPSDETAIPPNSPLKRADFDWDEE
ncbi:hypothetical protein VF21_03579 [Pseudogymnoascus sp. 05NY08]|nr:hypothetical protein VF21_03579 [Pseudogymnoascus sp. 05NY08]